MHHRDDTAGIGEPGAAREAAHHVEEVERVEVNLFVQRFHRRDLFLIDRQPVLRLAEREVHGQLAEEWRILGARFAFAERHDVVVERGQRLRLEVIPETLGIGGNPLVGDNPAGHVGLDPSGGHPHVLVVGESIEEGAFDEFRIERAPEQLGAAGGGGDHFIRRRSDRSHLEADLLQIDVQLLRQHLVDRIELEQPPCRRKHPLLLPPFRRADFGEADRDSVHRLSHQGRPDHVVQPAVTLLVRGQHRDRRGLLVGACSDQFGLSLLSDACAHLRRLAEPRLDGHSRPLLHGRNHLRAQLRPELVDLRRDLELVGAERASLLHVEILDVHGHRSRVDVLVCLPGDVRGEILVRFLDEHPDACGREILSLQLLRQFAELVERHRGLPGRRSPGDELPHLLLHIVERRAVFAAGPDVRKPLGELTNGPVDAVGVAARDDERALLSEGLLHQLNQPFAGLERRPFPLVVLDQRLDNRVRCSDQDEDWLAVGRDDRLRRFRDRNRHTGRFETEPRREIDDAGRAVAVGAEQHVDAIGNQVVVGVRQSAVVGVERGQIEVFLRAAAGPPRGRLRSGNGRSRNGRQVDRRPA